MTLSTVDLGELTRLVMSLRTEEGDIILTDLFPDDYSNEDLANLWLYVDEWRKSAALIESIVNNELAGRLEAQGHGVTVGEWIVFYGIRKDEKCVDEPAFHAWLRSQSPDLVEKVFNANTVRIGALPIVVRETFFEKRANPKAKKSLAAAPVQKVAEAKRRREMTG